MNDLTARDQWKTKIGLVLAMAGNAVGLGNFLRFLQAGDAVIEPIHRDPGHSLNIHDVDQFILPFAFTIKGKSFFGIIFGHLKIRCIGPPLHCVPSPQIERVGT